MRSPEINLVRPDRTFRVLLLGDSIANGGWWTDQSQTISALMERQLLPNNPDKYSHVEVLNAAANSWGPRNQLAYLQRFGTFQAQAIVLLINTDDLFATAPTAIQVGRDRHYPTHKPLLALVEAWQHYGVPYQSLPEMAAVYAETGDRVGLNLAAIDQIRNISVNAGSQFLLAITPLRREVEAGCRDYELTARRRLADLTLTAQILYVDFLPIFQSAQKSANLYQDGIHLNGLGNQIVSEAIAQLLEKIQG
jgi:lysophospholipase L1-like esterase